MEIANMQSTDCCVGTPREITIEERLIQRKTHLEAELKDVTSALEALQANPEILKIMCLISKVRY